MVLDIQAQQIPLRESNGLIYVGQTRVPLDTVIGTFNEGFSPEEIVYQYSALDLADVYSVIGYYLHHRAEVDEYVKQSQARSQEIREENEVRFNLAELREKLIARRKQI